MCFVLQWALACDLADRAAQAAPEWVRVGVVAERPRRSLGEALLGTVSDWRISSALIAAGAAIAAAVDARRGRGALGALAQAAGGALRWALG